MSDREIESLERETEDTRARVSGLLDELRGRISPGEMVDQMVGYAGDSAGEVVRTLGNQLRNNPLPALLVGVGVAWLMFSESRPRQAKEPAAASTGSSVTRARRLVAEAADRVSSTYENAGELATQAAGQVGDLGQRAADSTAELGQRAADALSQARHQTEDLGKRALDTANRILHEQPLVAAGIGLAIGAALGAALPATETENRLMGSTSDEIKNRARQAAADEYGQMKDTAQDIYGTVVDTVAREVSKLDESRPDDADTEERTQEHGTRSAG